MKNQDKINLLLNMQEHPEEYSDEQLNKMLAEDAELAELMEMAATTKRAFTKEEVDKEVINTDEQWEAFAAKHELEFDEPETKHVQMGMPLRKIAAMFIGVILTAGVAFAAVQIVRELIMPEQEVTQTAMPATTTQPLQQDETAPTDSITATNKTVTFDNVELNKILTEIATYYGAHVEFENNEAQTLRLYFEWNSQETLDHVVNRLNRFESINIELNDNKMIVK